MKINNSNPVNFLASKPQQSNFATKAISVGNHSELLSKAMNISVRSNSLARISFAGAKPVYEKNQTYISDIFSVQSTSVAKQNGPNPAFLVQAKSGKENGAKEIEVFTTTMETPILTLNKHANSAKLPKATLKAGKFDPTLELIDKELGIKVKLQSGSKIKGNSFDCVFPGAVKTQGRADKYISFGGHGHLQVPTSHNEPATLGAVQSYMEGKFYDKIEKGDFVDTMTECEPNFVVLGGGFGTRLHDLTNEDSNKPALKLPTDPAYRLIGNALDQAAKAGVIDGKNDNIAYLSGAGTIQGDDVFNVLQDKNLGDGGCIAKSIALGVTSADKPLIVFNADNITNADITRAFKVYHDNPDAAIVIPFYAASGSRAKDFGLMTAEKTEGKEALEIKSFVEKPKTLELAEPAKMNNTDKYMANPGIYIISPKALKMLGEMGNELIENPKELGLANDFIVPVVEMCQKGDFKNEDGAPMKAYTVALEAKGGKLAYWDDLGKTSAVIETCKHIASETDKHGNTPESNVYGLPRFLTEDIAKNTDLKTGVISMSEKAKVKLELFKEKYGITELEGNILVSDISE